MAAAVNVAQMQRIEKWSTSSMNAHMALKLQLEADKKSVDSLEKELETVKKDQARQRSESLACKGRGRRYSTLNGTMVRVKGQSTRAVDS